MLKRLKKWQVVTIIVVLILISITSCAGAFYISKLNLINYDHNSTISYDFSPVSGDTKDIGLPSDIEIEKDVSAIELPSGDIYKNEDVLNILLLGTDERSKEFRNDARSDSMMVMSLNLKNKTAKLVSFERGMGVPIEGRNIDWLTHTFHYGGANLVMKTIRDCFKLDLDKYIRVNFHTFEQLVDSVGGVEITLTEKEVSGLNDMGVQNIKAGVNQLNGSQALCYCRLRHIDSDWYRIQRQRTTIQAVINKTKNLSVFELNDLLNDVLPLVQTNLTKGEITSLITKAFNFRGVQLEQKTIPEKNTYTGAEGVDGRSFFKVDFEKNAEILRKFFYES
jgi:LCP family protein required for cell wall assembly